MYVQREREHMIRINARYLLNVVHSAILMEGNLEKKSGPNSMKRSHSRWCIVRRYPAARFQSIFEYYNRNPTEPKAQRKGMINVTSNVTSIQIVADPEVIALSADNLIPGHFNIIEQHIRGSAKPFSFILKTNERDFVFWAPNKQSFLHWIGALHFAILWMTPKLTAISYKNPLEVASIFYEFQLNPDFGSFLIENYCDSFRVHKIPNTMFRRVFARCMGHENTLLSDWILNCIRQLVPSMSLGWSALVNAVKHEIDAELSHQIQSVCHKLSEFDEKTDVLLAERIETQKKRNLSEAEKVYLKALILRFISFSQNTWMLPLPGYVFHVAKHNVRRFYRFLVLQAVLMKTKISAKSGPD